MSKKMIEPVIYSWSGGKDSAFGLYELSRTNGVRVASLITTVTIVYDRVCMHGVRRELLEAQASALGLPLHVIGIPAECSNEDYEKIMEREMLAFRDEGIATVAFADIFLADLKNYREQNLARVKMTARFPIFGRKTGELAREFIGLGFKAVLTAVDSEKLDGSFVGREYDQSLLNDLPKDVDPCGENGEFHTFVYDGPMFREPIEFEKGEQVLRDERFWFQDLLPLA